MLWIVLSFTLILTTSAAEAAYRLRPPSNPVLNSAHRDLKTIRAWIYVMAAADQVTNGDYIAERDFPIQALDDSAYPYEMMVSELRVAPWSDREHWTDAFRNPDSIRAWQNSTAQGKVFLAYINAGGLGADKYFNGVPMSARASWTDANGQPTASAPAWLLCADTSYSRLNWVLFYHPDFKKHLLTEVDYAITIGANGIVLDAIAAVVGKLRNDPSCARGQADNVDLAFEARRLVQEVRAYVKGKGLSRSFYVIASDGRDIYRKYRDFFSYVDGILNEMIFFRGYDHPGHMNGPEDPWLTADSIAYTRAVVAAGIAPFDLEYITDPAKIQRLADIASTNCFIPAVTQQYINVVSRPLNQMSCDGTHCTNNGVLLAPRDVSKCPMQLAAAVLPGSRSVKVGTKATAFATVINRGVMPASGCRLVPATTIPVTFSFQATDPTTNQVIGAPNTPVPIEPGGDPDICFWPNSVESVRGDRSPARCRL